MRWVSIDEIPEHSIVAKAVYTSSGSMLLKEDTPITEKVIRALRNQEILSIYVTDALTESIKEEMQLEDVFDLKDVIDPTLRRKFNQELIGGISAFKKAKGLSTFSKEGETLITRVNNISQNIVSELLLRKDRQITLVDVKHLDIYDYEHAVNTAILSVIVGINLGFSEADLMILAQGALLMNISNELLEPLIVNKSDQLSQTEYEIMKSHPGLSRQLLNDNAQANAHIKNIVLKHHERMDGSGYPNKLKAPEIDKYTKIVMIADVYDAMTSDRRHRRAHSPSETLEYIMGPSNLFDYASTYAFSRAIVPFPPGDLVELSDDRIALVLSSNDLLPLRPVVRVLTGANRNELIDLKTRYNIVIKRRVVSVE